MSKTIAQLKRQLTAQVKLVTQLSAQRAKIAAKLEKLDRKIAALAGQAAKPAKTASRKAGKKASKKAGKKVARKTKAKVAGARKLPKNAKPLLDCIKDVLAKSTNGMRVKEIVGAVRKAGYKTFSKDFYGIVAATVRDKSFEKITRGVYKVKGAAKAPAKKAPVEKAVAKKAPVKKAAAKKTAAKKPAKKVAAKSDK